ncbi:hypothetical protein VO01_12615 [Clavibacter michiganensis subsp. insidiosus]|uniref:Uncharacterized protein n=1 Tax=Clavibacter michiganensis subsp. insidiosus TaxID=33014 RepID=A0A0D5CKQ9_9MICO|nr:hypothetical protein VO01_12615 [Clavibacter michiganensis subsp. insidiosus]
MASVVSRSPVVWRRSGARSSRAAGWKASVWVQAGRSWARPRRSTCRKRPDCGRDAARRAASAASARDRAMPAGPRCTRPTPTSLGRSSSQRCWARRTARAASFAVGTSGSSAKEIHAAQPSPWSTTPTSRPSAASASMSS